MLYLFLAEGFEELEAIAPLDLLRRAGVAVRTVGVGGRTVTGAHGLPVTCDEDAAAWEPDGSFAGVILPGGPGYAALAESPAVLAAIRLAEEQGKLLAAICAAPAILGARGCLQGRRAVCFPGYEAQLLGAEVSLDPVMRDGNIITARGAGVAVAFGLALVAYLRSPEEAARIERAIQA
ncbi:MAG: DJ-1/PfpI family protein [Oscillospiraceae bacterium]|jgi:4-methyl-5(b-hydroxyethyl)-thiazole monophosphate biosynthesis|nr:DJ-1/PfpI family protein [Oscillospiraceae bacterium]